LDRLVAFMPHRFARQVGVGAGIKNTAAIGLRRHEAIGGTDRGSGRCPLLGANVAVRAQPHAAFDVPIEPLRSSSPAFSASLRKSLDGTAKQKQL
jgi:hypothetical protein